MISCFLPPETDMFFLAISMVGTDFSMICQLFPHRARSEIKVGEDPRYGCKEATQCLTQILFVKIMFVFQNKFKKEERANAWRIDKAFSNY